MNDKNIRARFLRKIADELEEGILEADPDFYQYHFTGWGYTLDGRFSPRNPYADLREV